MTATVNRVVWIIVGVLLTAAGLAGVLANRGALPGVDRDASVLTPSMDERWRSWGGWATGALIAAGLVLAILGLLLLQAQLPRRGSAAMPDLAKSTPVSSTSDTSVRAGHTWVSTNTLNQALARDLLGKASVRRAGVRLTGAPTKPELRVRLAVTPDANIDELRRHVEHAVRRFSTTSGLRPQLAEVFVRMSAGPRERVH